MQSPFAENCIYLSVLLNDSLSILRIYPQLLGYIRHEKDLKINTSSR